LLAVKMQYQASGFQNAPNLTGKFMTGLPDETKMGWDDSNQDDILRIASKGALWRMGLIIPDIIVVALMIREYLVR
jgi:hypothetical protein